MSFEWQLFLKEHRMPSKWLIWEWQLCPSKEKRSKQASSSWLTHVSCRTEDASNKPFELASSQVLSDSPFPIFFPYSPSLNSCWIFLTSCLPLHWKHMAGAHTRRQVCSPCCPWRPGGISNRVLEGICYSSSRSLFSFPLSLTHKHFSHPQGTTTAHHSSCSHPAAEIPETEGRRRELLSCQRCLSPCACEVSKKGMQIRIWPLELPGLDDPEISLWCRTIIPGSLPKTFCSSIATLLNYLAIR